MANFNSLESLLRAGGGRWRIEVSFDISPEILEMKKKLFVGGRKGDVKTGPLAI